MNEIIVINQCCPNYFYQLGFQPKPDLLLKQLRILNSQSFR